MKILLDEMLPAGVADLLPDHAITTVKAAGFTGLKNGELIRRAVVAGYEVLLTADRNLPAQQNLPASGMAIVLLPGNRVVDIRPSAEELQSTVQTAKPGTVARVPQRD